MCLRRALLMNDQKLLHCDSLPNSSPFQILNLGKLVCSREDCDVLKIRFNMKIKLTPTPQADFALGSCGLVKNTRQQESCIYKMFGVLQIILGCTVDYRDVGCSACIYISCIGTVVSFLVQEFVAGSERWFSSVLQVLVRRTVVNIAATLNSVSPYCC